MRKKLNFVSAIILTLFINTSCQKSQNSEKPNIILIMADDLGWGDVGYNRYSDIKTPNLDEMAQNGLRFDRFYSASALCSPTRGSCLTGRHPMRYGIGGANIGHLPREELTLAEILKENGYITGHFGKWHLGTLTTTEKDGNRGGRPGALEHYSPPWENGFDICFSTESRVPTYDPMITPTEDAGPLRGQIPGEPFESYYWYGHDNKATDNLEGDDSRVILDRVINFFNLAEEAQKPFFAVVWFHSPHEPVVGTPDIMKKYSEFEVDKQHYFSTVTALDLQIGRLRMKLKELKISKNTMLWFCSDNGPASQKQGGQRCYGNTGPYRNRKGSLYEGGIRVPGILEWPAKIKSGRITNIPVVTSDYYPTILDILNIEDKSIRPLDGLSIKPLIEGKWEARPRPIEFHLHNQISLCDNRYKIISLDNAQTFELYDLLEDQGETRDISLEKPIILDSMRVRLIGWVESCKKSLAGNDY
jgi:arylsulfatase A-like enzyme